MTSKVHRRKYRAFLSYSHANAAFVEKLHEWLTVFAGYDIWFDRTSLEAGSKVDDRLRENIAKCRGIILVLSKESVKSDWVNGEIDCALEERRNSDGDFEVVAVRIDDCSVPLQLRSTKRIDTAGGEFSVDVALQIIKAFYPGEGNPDPEDSRDIYVSAPWSRHDLTDLILGRLAGEGFRLIGDAKDQPGGDRLEPRVHKLLETCGAMVALVPEGEEPKYILRELGWAREMGMPFLVVASTGVVLPEEFAARAIRGTAAELVEGDALDRAIEDLYHDFRQPAHSHYFFYATGMQEDDAPTTDAVRDLVQRVTGLPCLVGDRLRTGPVADVILDRIRKATAVIANLGGGDAESGNPSQTARGGYNANSCIEAGMALGAGVRTYVIARGPRQRGPFMVRDEIKHYENELELLGIVHYLVAPDRRRIINAELGGGS